MELRFTLDTISNAAMQFSHWIISRKVIAFHGEMGVGKTTFIHSFCDFLGVKSTISSPTFSIINEYILADGSIIYHMDLYRLKSETEAIHAGIEDCLYSGNMCLVEWPDKIPGLLPPDTFHCELLSLSDNARKLRIKL